MLDDIQDSSELRRGKPATHTVFGPMQTINSAGYRFLDALNEVRKLHGEKCLAIFCGKKPLTLVPVRRSRWPADHNKDELRDLYVGQSYDIAWTCNLNCPTEEEYLAMIDGSESQFSFTAVCLRSSVNDGRRNGWSLQDAGKDVGRKVGISHQARRHTLNPFHDIAGPLIPDTRRLHEFDVGRCKSCPELPSSVQGTKR